MKTLIISAFAAAVLATAASTANAIQCPPWTCSSNGTQLTGIALPNIRSVASRRQRAARQQRA